MSTKNSWKSYGGIYKTQEVTNLGIGTLVVDEIVTRKKVLETLVFEQILTLENDFIQEIGNVNTYGISKFDRSTYHNADVYIKNKIILAGNNILERDSNADAQGALATLVGGDNVVPLAGDAKNFIYGDVTGNRISFGTDTPTSFVEIEQPSDDDNEHNIFTVATRKSIGKNTLLKTVNNSGVDISVNASTSRQSFAVSGNINGNLISTSNTFTIDNTGVEQTIQINSYDICLNASNINEISSSVNTVINSGNYTQLRSKTAISNREEIEGMKDETFIVYDNNHATYLKDYYNTIVDEYTTGNAVTLLANDSSGNTFQHIITPDYKGFAIGGGSAVSDNTKSLGILGILIDDSSTTDSSFVPGISITETGHKSVNRSVTSINTYSPNTLSHTMEINGATHIGHGEIHIRAYANFYINNVSFSKQYPLYGFAIGKKLTSSTSSPYTYYYLKTVDGGSNWTVEEMNDGTYKQTSSLLLTAVPAGSPDDNNKSYLFDTNSTETGFLTLQNNSTQWIVGGPNVNVKILCVNFNDTLQNPQHEYFVKSTDATTIYFNSSSGTDVAAETGGITNIIDITGDSNRVYLLDTAGTVISYTYENLSVDIINKEYHQTPTTPSTFNKIYAFSIDSVVAVGNNTIFYSNNASTDGPTWTQLTNTGYNLTQIHLPNERNAVALGTRIIDNVGVLLYSDDYYHTWHEVDDNILNASGAKQLVKDALQSTTNVSIHMSGLSTIIISYVLSDDESRIIYCHLPNLLNKEHSTILDVSGNMHMSGVVYQF
jgi:hypothetical protein